MGLTTRYPELLFLMQILPEEDIEFEWRAIHQEIKGAEVLYVFGYTPKIRPILQWLDEDQTRDVVFIEDEISVVRKMQEEEGACEILQNDQIHFRFLMPGKDLESFSAEIVMEFPTPYLSFINIKEKNYDRLQMLLLRKSVVEDAIHNEMLHYHKLFANLKENLYRLPNSFTVAEWKDAFALLPAIVCGAGPSLANVSEELRALTDRALIMAGGSGISALNNLGIIPHLAFALDPNEEEFTRLAFHTSYDTPLIFATRVEPEIFRAHVGPTGYIPTGTGGGVERWFEEELGIEDPKILKKLNEEAMSVTSVALMTAIHLGCNPIILVGIDLSYEEGKRYVPGVASEQQCSLEEQSLRAEQVVHCQNGKVTLTRWIMEADVLSWVAKEHPDRVFIDGTACGLGFDHILPNRDFSDLCNQVYDVKGMVHERVMDTSLDCSKEFIKEKMRHFKESLERCRVIIEETIKEMEALYENAQNQSRKLTLHEMDLEEELAYQIALKQAFYAWTFPLKKEHRPSSDPKNLFRIKVRLYAKMKSIVDDYLSNLLPCSL